MEERTKNVGLDSCIDAPLNKLKIDKVFSDFINIFVFKVTYKLLKKLGDVSSFPEMIDDLRIKRVFLESSFEIEKSFGSFQRTNSN